MLIARFDPAVATPAQLAEQVALEVAASAVDQPGEPPLGADWVLARLTRTSSAGLQRLRWIAREQRTGQLAGVARLVLFGGQDSDLAVVDIIVGPEHRRRGIGTALLRAVSGAAGSRDCLFIEGIRAGTAAQAFADALGFAVVQRTIRLSLDLAAADRGRWEVAPAPGYRLERWAGRSPAELLGSYAAARNAISDAPTGDASFSEPAWSPQRVRDEEATAAARQCELRVVAAVAEQSAEVAGYTCLEVHESQPDVAIQQDTAVLAAHRGHGLGAWMKSASLIGLTTDHPAVRRVRTSNAAGNVHMMRVNRQVGFTEDLSMENREARLADLRA